MDSHFGHKAAAHCPVHTAEMAADSPYHIAAAVHMAAENTAMAVGRRSARDTVEAAVCMEQMDIAAVAAYMAGRGLSAEGEQKRQLQKAAPDHNCYRTWSLDYSVCHNRYKKLDPRSREAEQGPVPSAYSVHNLYKKRCWLALLSCKPYTDGSQLARRQ